MKSVRELWKETFGRWWWLMFDDGSTVGPMGLRRARRWGYDAPQPYYFKWSRKTPSEEDSV